MKYLFGGGYLPGKCASVRGIGVSWKIMCSRTRQGLLENQYLFDEKKEACGKFVCVRGVNKGFWENYYLFDEIIRSFRRTDRTSLKKHVFSMDPPGKLCLFEEQMDPPEKI